jgi:hypothetical protein
MVTTHYLFVNLPIRSRKWALLVLLFASFYADTHWTLVIGTRSKRVAKILCNFTVDSASCFKFMRLFTCLASGRVPSLWEVLFPG